MKKKTSLAIAAALIIGGVCYVNYALNHPEASLPLGNRATFLLYGVYIWLIFHFVAIEPRRKERTKGSALLAGVFFLIAVVFLIMELAAKTTDLNNIHRTYIALIGLDIAVNEVLLLRKKAKGK